MTEFPGYLPWHVAGDPWLTYDEIDALTSVAKARADEARKQQKAKPRRPARAVRRAPRRR